MKKFLLVLFLLPYIFINAQIPNPGFETWTGNTPEGWAPLNFPGIGEPTTKSTDSHSGSAAAKLEMITIAGGGVLPPLLTSLGFPVSAQHGSLQGYYKFSPVSGEELSIGIVLWGNGQPFAAGSVQIFDPASSYTLFQVPIFYGSGEVPDSAQIYIAVADTGDFEDAGAFALIDDLSFGGVVGVDDQDFTASDFQLYQNYPNPFNPSTTIQYDVPAESFVELKVFDMIGNEVATLINERHSSGNYKVNFNGASLASGTYIVRMKAGGYLKSSKMILMK